MRGLTCLFAAALLLAGVTAAQAASLQVAPVTIDLTAPAQSAAVHLKNSSGRKVNVQVRVFKWEQVNGEERLTPTRDVVASPPAASLQPNTTYTIRVGRTAPPVGQGEESYRLFIDELPDVNLRRPPGSVNLVIRYSIPVFFAERNAGAQLQWEVKSIGGNIVAQARNTGSRHAKIADLAVATASGRVSFGSGLNGYVLPGSTKRWSVKSGRIKSGSRVTITAKGDDYAVNQTAIVTER